MTSSCWVGRSVLCKLLCTHTDYIEQSERLLAAVCDISCDLTQVQRNLPQTHKKMTQEKEYEEKFIEEILLSRFQDY